MSSVSDQKSKIGNQKSIPSLIIFDLGRVLVDICDSWRHACQIAGITIERAGDLSEDERAEMRRLVAANETGRLEQADFCREASPLLKVEPAHVGSISDVYLLRTFPGAIELIDELNAAGVQTACLSNTNAHHWSIMLDRQHPAWVPLERFTHSFASHLIGHRKPADAIYEHVERITGMSGGEIAFFDDLPENVDAAAARGWQARQIMKGSSPIEQIRRYLDELGVL